VLEYPDLPLSLEEAMSKHTRATSSETTINQHRSLKVEGFKVVSARLRSAEYETFSYQARLLGLSDSMAIRVAVRRIGGFLEIDADTREKMEAILQSIGILSSNVSMLLSAYAEDPRSDLEAVRDERIAFGEAFAALDGLLRSILSVSRRRIDGRSLLKGAL
jgi:type IV secretion system T-DNA border endonuclease VirD1